MAIAFSCPHCGNSFSVDDSYAGQRGPCASCGQQITVPGGAAAFASSAQSDPVPAKGSSAPMIIGILLGTCAVLFVCGGVLVALLLPAIQAAREAARRNQCINNCKNLGLSMHNHHDVNNRLPLASNELVSGIPGHGPGPSQAGYSWLTALLPYCEEIALFDQISGGADKFQKPPFDPSWENAGMHPATVQVQLFRCPSYSGPNNVDQYNSDYEEYQSTTGKSAPAISNYIVLPSTHILNATAPVEIFSGTNSGGVVGNGAIVFPETGGSLPWKGIGLRAMTDGTSKTVLFCETKEEAYAAWIDGQATWAVGAWPENLELPGEGETADGFLGFSDSDSDSMTSLEAAEMAEDGDTSFAYMVSSRFGGSNDRMFGPSSNHTGGVVVHCFGDGHVSALSPTIDRNVYLQIISRNGGEPVQLDDY